MVDLRGVEPLSGQTIQTQRLQALSH